MSIANPARGQKPRATMKQVAALAGVGTKTVSRVVNDEPNVAPGTAKRVWDAVRALDYHVDLQAGSLRRTDGRTRTLGLLISSVDNPFAGAIHRAVEDAATERGVAVFASSLDDDADREERAVTAFLQRRVDGLILTTAGRRQNYVAHLQDRGIPVVYVDREPRGTEADSVTSDNRAAARAGTEWLISHGHRRIALLADRREIPTAAEREGGFLDATREAGIPTAQTPVIAGLRDADAAHRALKALLESDQPPTAVFSAQNLITIGAIHALREAGAEHSVALVGFDDVPLADLLDPGITVIAQDPQEIGRIAVARIFERLEGDTSPALHHVVPTSFVPRGSGEIPPPSQLPATASA
jgi:LacI family transcriptional regulator